MSRKDEPTWTAKDLRAMADRIGMMGGCDPKGVRKLLREIADDADRREAENKRLTATVKPESHETLCHNLQSREWQIMSLCNLFGDGHLPEEMLEGEIQKLREVQDRLMDLDWTIGYELTPEQYEELDAIRDLCFTRAIVCSLACQGLKSMDDLP